MFPGVWPIFEEKAPGKNGLERCSSKIAVRGRYSSQLFSGTLFPIFFGGCRTKNGPSPKRVPVFPGSPAREYGQSVAGSFGRFRLQLWSCWKALAADPQLTSRVPKQTDCT